MCELAEQLEQEKTRCEGVVRQNKQEVNQFFQTLEAALAKKKQAFLEALDKAATDVSRAYDPLIHRVKELQVGLTRCHIVTYLKYTMLTLVKIIECF